MGKTIKLIKTIAFIAIMVQIALIILFTVFYFNDIIPDFKEIVLPEYIAIGAASFVLLDCLFIWISIIIVSSLKNKTDLKAAEVIGGDIQEAYNFGMIGLAITNEDDVVIWTNDLFKERHIDIIDTNIFYLSDELATLKESNFADQTAKVVVNNRTYEVKFLQEALLWIFKDITDYESVYTYSKQQAPVVGLLTIDNYDDVIRGDDDFNDMVTKVKNVIFAYTKDYGILLRRVKDDTYSLLCNFDSYSRMKADKFSIIDKVREVSSSSGTPLTLSIGLAHDFPDVIKLNELANEAIDIAMSRGGDQVVVSVYGSEMEFYGGKTEAQEKRNRVKIRVLADSLISLLKSASNVLVVGHTNMDMDAFGACLGIKAICNHLGVDSMIVADLKNTESKTRAAMISTFSKDELDKIIVNSKEAPDYIKSETLLVVCDVHIPKMVMDPTLLDKVSKVVVIDHHRRAEDYIENPVFNHIDAAASSTCEIIAEFIKFSSINPRVNIPASYATIMLSGIFLDSTFYKSRNTGIRTFEASTILKEFGADNALADDYLKDDYEEHKMISELTNSIEHPFYGVVIALADEGKIYDNATISKAANACLAYKGVRASFVIGKTGNKEIKVSARSDGSINVQLLTEKIGGGGHYSMAAAALEKSTIKEARDMLVGVLDNYLSEATNDSKHIEEAE